MAKNVTVVTHGVRVGGALPKQTKAGLAQIASLPEIKDATMIVLGTGVRFQQTYAALVEAGKLDGNLPVKHSPFCGSADGLDVDTVNKAILIVLANGTRVYLENYIGFGSTKAFDPWVFLEELPDGAVLCAGGELMEALGVKSPPKAGMFTVDVDNKTCTLVAKG